MSDWAEERARKWLLMAGLDPEFRIPVGLALGATREASLAALLREVVKESWGEVGKAAQLQGQAQRRAHVTDDVRRLIDLAGDWIETDPSLRSTACIEVALDHAKELEAEVERSRALLADVRRVVEDVQKSIWGGPRDTGSAVTLCCDEILARLGKL